MAVFEDDNAPPRPDNFLEALVGDDKKFKTAEDLAKGKWESDNYIQSVKEENERLKEELAAQKRVEDLLKERLPNQQVREPEAHQPAQAEDKQALNKEELATLIRELSEEDNRTRTVQQNVNEVADKLTQLFGSEDKAQEVVRNRARELGVSVKFLQEVAAQSPKAFFAQLGVEPESKPASSGPTRSDVNTSAFNKTNTPKPRTYAWWVDLRKADPQQYQKLTLQRHTDAQELGEAFYS